MQSAATITPIRPRQMQLAPRLAPALRATLTAIHAHIEAHGYSPSVRDIQAATGTSSASVTQYRCRWLRDMGYVTYITGLTRTIRVTDNGRHALEEA